MTRDEDVLRDLLTTAAPSFDTLDGTAVRERAESRRSSSASRWPRAVPAAAAALVILVIAIGAYVLARSATHATGPASGDGAGTFRLQLELDGTRFPADGTPIHATVLIINHTGKPIEIHDASCDRWLQAGLTGGYAKFELISHLAGCPSSYLREGVTRKAVTIDTTYTRCLEGNQPGTAATPHCTDASDSNVPALPTGKYQVMLGTINVSPGPALPPPLQITLTPVNR